jgi:hypothetical protein
MRGREEDPPAAAAPPSSEFHSFRRFPYYSSDLPRPPPYPQRAARIFA